jgi:uncharacterized protein YdeI (BOF family)
MKNFAIFLASSLISVSAFADFNGSWQGKGNYTDGEGYTEMCSTMKLELAQSASEFSITSGGFECESLKIALNPATFTVQDGEIVDKDGNYLGSADDSYFFVKSTDAQTQWTVTYQVEITSDGMEYKQTTLDDGGNIVFTIDGILNK